MQMSNGLHFVYRVIIEQHHVLNDCPAYSLIQSHTSAVQPLFSSGFISKAAFLSTDQSNVVGSYLKT